MLAVRDHTLAKVVREELFVTEPTVAVIVVEPVDTQVASPVVGLTVATVGVLDIQFARLVTLVVVPSE
jgi:hypothetical protein